MRRSASRRSVWGRILTAFPIGYAAIGLVVMALARTLPGDAAQRTQAAGLLSFALYTGLIVYVFAAASARRAFAITIAIGAAAGAVAWISIHLGGRA